MILLIVYVHKLYFNSQALAKIISNRKSTANHQKNLRNDFTYLATLMFLNSCMLKFDCFQSNNAKQILIRHWQVSFLLDFLTYIRRFICMFWLCNIYLFYMLFFKPKLMLQQPLQLLNDPERQRPKQWLVGPQLQDSVIFARDSRSGL